jgi:hypothetical protein
MHYINSASLQPSPEKPLLIIKYVTYVSSICIAYVTGFSVLSKLQLSWVQLVHLVTLSGYHVLLFVHVKFACIYLCETVGIEHLYVYM